MKATRVTLLCFLCAFANYAAAGDFHFHGITIAIPAAFDGPMGAKPNSAANMVGFAVPGTAGVPTNTLQISHIEVTEKIPDQSDSERFETLSKYLLNMLGAVERRRTEYSQTPPEKVHLGHFLAVRASWKGKAQDFQVNGVVYCVLVGSGIVFVYTSGPGEKPDAQQMLAIKAVNALSIDG
jgi:hypothetical protein